MMSAVEYQKAFRKLQPYNNEEFCCIIIIIIIKKTPTKNLKF
jgi:hypothetical protein